MLSSYAGCSVPSSPNTGLRTRQELHSQKGCDWLAPHLCCNCFCPLTQGPLKNTSSPIPSSAWDTHPGEQHILPLMSPCCAALHTPAEWQAVVRDPGILCRALLTLLLTVSKSPCASIPHATDSKCSVLCSGRS